MKRILLVVAYDGSSYHGWQIQSNADTIEGELNRALTQLTGEKVEVIGASRTDAGVHALGNVAVFDSHTLISPEKIHLALNQRLPEDIIVQSSHEVPLEFHPRHVESRKTYAYKILNRKVNLPTTRKYAYFIYRPLDVDKMKEAAGYLVGEHDFTSFCSVGAQAESKVRTVFSLDVDQHKEFVTIRVEGSGFLYNMVRIIAGTLLWVGEGKWEPIRVKKALESRDRKESGPTAPAHGLILEKILYKTDNSL